MKEEDIKLRNVIPRDSELAETVRVLNDLMLIREQRRELIEGCYGCLGILGGFNKELKLRSQEAFKNNLRGEGAFDYIVTSLNKYDQKKAQEIAMNYPQKTYPTF